jgi:hypothetical protein
MNKRFITVSKFLSQYLRHEPEALGLTVEACPRDPAADANDGAARRVD